MLIPISFYFWICAIAILFLLLFLFPSSVVVFGVAVKVWCTSQRRSTLTVETKANICCVKWNPWRPEQVAFGSADHQVHLYDLRQPRQALHVLNGHRKAVSYVKFLSADQVVSASTDSTLKLWDVSGASPSHCKRTFEG
jgi:E3 ubiquitin-protein ligase RFWD2